MRGRIAVVLATATAVFAVSRSVVLAISDRLFSAETLVEGFPLVDLGAIAGAVIGALIVTRHPTHRVGWLFVVGQLFTEIGVASHAFGVAAIRGELPGSALGPTAIAVGLQLGAFPTLALLGLLFLLAPSGEWPQGRWIWPVWAISAGLVLHVIGIAYVPTDRINETGQVTDPGPPATQWLTLAAYLLIASGAISGAASLFFRLRRSDGRTREQLAWMTLAATALAVTAVFTLLSVEWLDIPSWLSLLPLMTAYACVPLFTGISILKHQMFGIEVVLNRAIVLTLLTGTATAMYVGVVVVISRPAPSSMTDLGLVPSMAIAALVALALQPVRAKATQAANRLVYGAQAAPYVTLASFTRELQEIPHPSEMLDGVAQAIGRTVGASEVRLHIAAAPHMDWRPTTVIWTDGESPIGLHEPDWTAAVRADKGVVVGEVAVTMPPGRGLRNLERQLLVDFTTQVEHAISNVQLGAELSARAKELSVATEKLEASRRRLVVARDEERSRFEAAIRHVVLPHLEPLPDALQALANDLRSSDAHAQAKPNEQVPNEVAQARIDDLIARSNQAVEALRTVTRGVFPAQLARRGVPVALMTHLRATRPRAELIVQDWWTDRRLEPRVESTIYFTVVDLLDTMKSVQTVELAAETPAAPPNRNPDDPTVVQATVTLTGGVEATTSRPLRLLTDRLAVFDGTVRSLRATGQTDGYILRMPIKEAVSSGAEASAEATPRS